MDVFGIKGSGIGLPSVKKIIDNHHGSIDVSSTVGIGTTLSFTIRKMHLGELNNCAKEVSSAG